MARPDERDMLTILALCEPCNIPRLEDLARAAHVRETASRAHRTTSLRKPLPGARADGLRDTLESLRAAAEPPTKKRSPKTWILPNGKLIRLVKG